MRGGRGDVKEEHPLSVLFICFIVVRSERATKGGEGGRKQFLSMSAMREGHYRNDWV